MSDYCGVILAGGKGTRMGEMTRVTNKHLLPVGDRPMIYHPIKKMVDAGVCNIMLVTGTEHMGDFVNLLGSGKSFGCDLTYKVQDEAGGIAQALGLAEHFCRHSDQVLVLLGDNIFEDSLALPLRTFRDQPTRATVFLKEVPDPQRYGVAHVGYDKDKLKQMGVKDIFQGPRILGIEEKPADPKSSLAVVGIYTYPNDVFALIRSLCRSARGEFEITDVNNHYLQQDRLDYYTLWGYWTDAGTLPSWQEANRLVSGRPPVFNPIESPTRTPSANTELEPDYAI